MSMFITQSSQPTTTIAPPTPTTLPASRRRRECAERQIVSMEHQPSPTAGTLTYKTPKPQSRYRKALARLPIVAFVSVMACGLYGSTIVRGGGPGSLPKLVILNALLVSPAVGILLGMLLGFRQRHYVGAIGLLLVVPPLAADAYGTLEERMFVAGARELPHTSPRVYKTARWWPNGSSYLYYEPSTGELGGGD